MGRRGRSRIRRERDARGDSSFEVCVKRTGALLPPKVSTADVRSFLNIALVRVWVARVLASRARGSTRFAKEFFRLENQSALSGARVTLLVQACHLVVKFIQLLARFSAQALHLCFRKSMSAAELRLDLLQLILRAQHILRVPHRHRLHCG